MLLSGQSAAPFLSAHDLIFAEYAYAAAVTAEEVSTYLGRRWDQVDQGLLAERLLAVDWLFLTGAAPVDDMVARFSEVVEGIVEEQAPLRRFKRRRFVVLGVTPEVRNLIADERRSYRSWRRTVEVSCEEDYSGQPRGLAVR